METLTPNLEHRPAPAERDIARAKCIATRVRELLAKAGPGQVVAVTYRITDGEPQVPSAQRPRALPTLRPPSSGSRGWVS